jgi:purine-binding chemotaxis protein CheW
MSVLHVVFKIGDADYVLPASDVLQLESFDGATKVPGTQPYVAGIVQVRGRVVPVVDGRERFGLPPIEHGLNSRVVVSQLGERTVGLLVDSGREVIKLEPDQLKPPPPMVAEQAKGFVEAVAQVGPRLLMLLNLRKVIGEETANGK